MWRTNLQSSLFAYDARRYYPAVAFYHDLTAGAYLADRLTNEGKPVRLNSSPQFSEAYFSPDSIRGRGIDSRTHAGIRMTEGGCLLLGLVVVH